MHLKPQEEKKWEGSNEPPFLQLVNIGCTLLILSSWFIALSGRYLKSSVYFKQTTRVPASNIGNDFYGEARTAFISAGTQLSIYVTHFPPTGKGDIRSILM